MGVKDCVGGRNETTTERQHELIDFGVLKTNLKRKLIIFANFLEKPIRSEHRERITVIMNTLKKFS